MYNIIIRLTVTFFEQVHWMQSVLSKRFRKYDLGRKMNRIRYGQDEPPEYPLENITNKYMALFTAANDWMADPKDVDILRSKLKGMCKKYSILYFTVHDIICTKAVLELMSFLSQSSNSLYEGCIRMI